MNQTELGRLYGVSCKVLGDWLIESGLRTRDRKPSQKAFEGGFVSQASLTNGGYYYKWHREKTINALKEAGHRPKTPVSTGKIVGPFTARQSSENGYEVLGGDGTVSIWIIGRWNAQIVTKLLNLAYRYGLFNGGE